MRATRAGEDVDLCLRGAASPVTPSCIAATMSSCAPKAHPRAWRRTVGHARAPCHDARNDVRFFGAWAAILDEDVELAAATWDAELHEARAVAPAGPGRVVIEGQPGGLAPAGDEARAMTAACTAAGLAPAARDEPFPRVAPRLEPRTRALLYEALGRELPRARRASSCPPRPRPP